MIFVGQSAKLSVGAGDETWHRRFRRAGSLGSVPGTDSVIAAGKLVHARKSAVDSIENCSPAAPAHFQNHHPIGGSQLSSVQRADRSGISENELVDAKL